MYSQVSYARFLSMARKAKKAYPNRSMFRSWGTQMLELIKRDHWVMLETSPVSWTIKPKVKNNGRHKLRVR